MKICFKQLMVMYFLCISFVLCAVSCDGRSVIPSRSKPGFIHGDPTSDPRWLFPKDNWMLAKADAEPSTLFPSLIPLDSSRMSSYQYPLPTAQPSYYQIPGAASYPTSFEYQSPQLQDNWNTWNQYQSPLTGGSDLTLTDLLTGRNSFGTGSGYGSNYGSNYGSSYGSSLRLPSSYQPRQPDIVINEYPSSNSKYGERLITPDFEYKPIFPKYSEYGRASSSAQVSSIPSTSNIGDWSGYGSLGGLDKPSVTSNSGLRRTLNVEGESLNRESKPAKPSGSKSDTNDAKGNDENTRRYLSNTGDSKKKLETKSVNESDNNKSTNNSKNEKAAESKSIAQNDDTPQNDNLKVETRLDLSSSLAEDSTQKDKLENVGM